jgi:hypothetical protein
LLLNSPRPDVRELALRASSRLIAQPLTAAERWLEAVHSHGEGILKQLKPDEAQPVGVCVHTGDSPYGEWEMFWEGTLFLGYVFADGSLLWKGLSVWRRAFLLAGTGAADADALWYSAEPVVLRRATEEEIDQDQDF